MIVLDAGVDFPPRRLFLRVPHRQTRFAHPIAQKDHSHKAVHHGETCRISDLVPDYAALD
jgi:hypothetical protein